MRDATHTKTKILAPFIIFLVFLLEFEISSNYLEKTNRKQVEIENADLLPNYLFEQRDLKANSAYCLCADVTKSCECPNGMKIINETEISDIPENIDLELHFGSAALTLEMSKILSKKPKSLALSSKEKTTLNFDGTINIKLIFYKFKGKFSQTDSISFPNLNISLSEIEKDSNKELTVQELLIDEISNLTTSPITDSKFFKQITNLKYLGCNNINNYLPITKIEFNRNSKKCFSDVEFDGAKYTFKSEPDFDLSIDTTVNNLIEDEIFLKFTEQSSTGVTYYKKMTFKSEEKTTINFVGPWEKATSLNQYLIFNFNTNDIINYISNKVYTANGKPAQNQIQYRYCISNVEFKCQDTMIFIKPDAFNLLLKSPIINLTLEVGTTPVTINYLSTISNEIFSSSSVNQIKIQNTGISKINTLKITKIGFELATFDTLIENCIIQDSIISVEDSGMLQFNKIEAQLDSFKGNFKVNNNIIIDGSKGPNNAYTINCLTAKLTINIGSVKFVGFKLEGGNSGQSYFELGSDLKIAKFICSSTDNHITFSESPGSNFEIELPKANSKYLVEFLKQSSVKLVNPSQCKSDFTLKSSTELLTLNTDDTIELSNLNKHIKIDGGSKVLTDFNTLRYINKDSFPGLDLRINMKAALSKIEFASNHNTIWVNGDSNLIYGNSTIETDSDLINIDFFSNAIYGIKLIMNSQVEGASLIINNIQNYQQVLSLKAPPKRTYIIYSEQIKFPTHRIQIDKTSNTGGIVEFVEEIAAYIKKSEQNDDYNVDQDTFVKDMAKVNTLKPGFIKQIQLFVNKEITLGETFVWPPKITIDSFGNTIPIVTIKRESANDDNINFVGKNIKLSISDVFYSKDFDISQAQLQDQASSSSITFQNAKLNWTHLMPTLKVKSGTSKLKTSLVIIDFGAAASVKPVCEIVFDECSYLNSQSSIKIPSSYNEIASKVNGETTFSDGSTGTITFKKSTGSSINEYLHMNYQSITSKANDQQDININMSGEQKMIFSLNFPFPTLIKFTGTVSNNYQIESTSYISTVRTEDTIPGLHFIEKSKLKIYFRVLKTLMSTEISKLSYLYVELEDSVKTQLKNIVCGNPLNIVTENNAIEITNSDINFTFNYNPPPDSDFFLPIKIGVNPDNNSFIPFTMIVYNYTKLEFNDGWDSLPANFKHVRIIGNAFEDKLFINCNWDKHSFNPALEIIVNGIVDYRFLTMTFCLCNVWDGNCRNGCPDLQFAKPEDLSELINKPLKPNNITLLVGPKVGVGIEFLKNYSSSNRHLIFKSAYNNEIVALEIYKNADTPLTYELATVGFDHVNVIVNESIQIGNIYDNFYSNIKCAVIIYQSDLTNISFSNVGTVFTDWQTINELDKKWKNPYKLESVSTLYLGGDSLPSKSTNYGFGNITTDSINFINMEKYSGIDIRCNSDTVSFINQEATISIAIRSNVCFNSSRSVNQSLQVSSNFNKKIKCYYDANSSLEIKDSVSNNGINIETNANSVVSLHFNNRVYIDFNKANIYVIYDNMISNNYRIEEIMDSKSTHLGFALTSIPSQLLSTNTGFEFVFADGKSININYNVISNSKLVYVQRGGGTVMEITNENLYFDDSIFMIEMEQDSSIEFGVSLYQFDDHPSQIIVDTKGSKCEIARTGFWLPYCIEVINDWNTEYTIHPIPPIPTQSEVKELGEGAIIGISVAASIVGGFIILGIIVLCVICCRKNYARRNEKLKKHKYDYEADPAANDDQKLL